MTAPAHRMHGAHEVPVELLRRARRVLVVLLFLAAAGVGTALAVFVTPHLVPILGVLALVALLAVIVQQVICLCRDDADPSEDSTPGAESS